MAGLTAVSADELAALEIFKGCRPDALVTLAAQLRPLNAPAGRVLMRQGERAESFLLIDSGKAEITHMGSDGVPTVLELSPPLIVGEIALLRETPRTATVVATEPLTGMGRGPRRIRRHARRAGHDGQVGADGAPTAGGIHHADPGSNA